MLAGPVAVLGVGTAGNPQRLGGPPRSSAGQDASIVEGAVAPDKEKFLVWLQIDSSASAASWLP